MPSAFIPRQYQRDDVAAAIEAMRTHRRAIGRAATGLGKACMVAMLADHYVRTTGKRVLILVDVAKLVRDLAETVEWVTGTPPGIEMADRRAMRRDGMIPAERVVVASFQSMYAPEVGKERFREFEPADFALVIADECETIFPADNRSRSVIDWFLSNPACHLFGCTATPFRSDGTAAAEAFDAVAFDHDIIWGIEEGWLVSAKQAFIHVNIDFSSLKVRSESGDYTSDDVADLLLKVDEAEALKLAKAVLKASEFGRTIVVCPRVDVARAIADWINGDRPGASRCIYGALGDEEKDDIFRAHEAGEFPILTSCSMLTKGYNDRRVAVVVNCRPTKSRRLFQQIVGRGTRTLADLVDRPELMSGTAEARRAAIAASAKPHMILVNLVNVDQGVRDLTVVDILGERKAGGDEQVIDRAKELQLADPTLDVDQAVEQAAEEVEAEREANQLMAAEAQALSDAVDASVEAEMRRRAQVEAEVHVEFVDDLTAVAGGGITHSERMSHVEGITAKQWALLEKQIPERDLRKFAPLELQRLAKVIPARMRQGLCSYKQAKLLQDRFGYTKADTAHMTREEAGRILDARMKRREVAA